MSEQAMLGGCLQPWKTPVTKMMGFLGGNNMANQKPVWKTQAGQISVALWQNDAMIGGRSVKMLKATIERRYKDASGEWRSSNSLNRNEISLAVYALQAAFGQIIERSKSDGDDVVVEEDLSA